MIELLVDVREQCRHPRPAITKIELQHIYDMFEYGRLEGLSPGLIDLADAWALEKRGPAFILNCREQFRIREVAQIFITKRANVQAASLHSSALHRRHRQRTGTSGTLCGVDRSYS